MNWADKLTEEERDGMRGQRVTKGRHEFYDYNF